MLMILATLLTATTVRLKNLANAIRKTNQNGIINDISSKSKIKITYGILSIKKKKKKKGYSQTARLEIPRRFGRNSGNRISGITGIFVARISRASKFLEKHF